MKRAFMVLGAESSGTRIWTRVLIACGCVGDGWHEQRWDTEPITGEMVVFRRSCPHRNTWPSVADTAFDLRRDGYQVSAYVTVRDFWATACSQVNRQHAGSLGRAIENIQRAYAAIFPALLALDVPYAIITYELIGQPAYRKKMLSLLGLREITEIETITDENVKHYNGPCKNEKPETTTPNPDAGSCAGPTPEETAGSPATTIL